MRKWSREIKREREREKEGGREGERGRERKREREKERNVEYGRFIFSKKGMRGALAPVSYLVMILIQINLNVRSNRRHRVALKIEKGVMKNVF